MHSPALTCLDNARRQTVRAKGLLSGIDYVEVVDDHDQRELCVHLFGKVPEPVAPANVRIEGGRRIRNIHVTSVSVAHADDPEVDDCLCVVVDKPGDFSTYRLCLVAVDAGGHPTAKPLHGFDPRYTCVDFSFKVGCPSDLDCQAESACTPEDRVEPEITYLAKDYASFRQLILDRLALLMPDWQERHVPDLGITLVELLAYVGDYLSYYQDAVATEAYLDMARQRISVRRHARLVDYFVHEGCNARAWVCVETDAKVLLLDPRDFYFITGYNDALAVSSSVLSQDDVDKIPAGHYQVFRPLADQGMQFRRRDVINPAALAGKLREAHDDVAKYLRGQFSSATQQLLEHYNVVALPSDVLQEALVAELNQLLHNDSLSDQQGFLPPRLSAETRQLLAQNPRGADLTRLNRLLLEDAYPDDIAPSGQMYLYKAHNTMCFYTWGDQECCLPRGATSATLRDEWVAQPLPAAPQYSPPPELSKYATMPPAAASSDPARPLHLQVGDILIFEEVLGPKTAHPADADPAHRCAVRLTKVEPGEDPLCHQPIIDIEWAAEDALPFALCLSTTPPPTRDKPECKPILNISVARGNVMLVDHGRLIDDETMHETVPTKETLGACVCTGGMVEMTAVPGIFRPLLQHGPVTFSQQPSFTLPASAMLTQEPRGALPQVHLTSIPTAPGGGGWTPRFDLLSSQSEDDHFVVEIDNDERAHLRFGDGAMGRMPEAKMTFSARYRVGNGRAGNVSAETISYIVTNEKVANLRPRNPMPAQGGIDAEPMAEVKLFAAGAFRKDLQRAITADDYAQLAQRHPNVQRASARLRWTGSWYEARVALDPLGTEQASDTLLHTMQGALHRYQRLGHDLMVTRAHYVPLDVELTVCVLPHYLRGHVKAALLDVFSNRVLRNGNRGFFHPDNLTFGAGVYLSKLVAVAQAVPGVQSVTVTKLERLYEGPDSEIANGILPCGSDEIAQLDNDPSFPEQGNLKLMMRGGR